MRDIFRKQGFLVIRAAQSKPIDLVCMKDGRSMLIECKAGRSFLGEDRRKELLSLSEQAGAVMVLARRRKRSVELTKLADGQTLDLRAC